MSLHPHIVEQLKRLPAQEQTPEEILAQRQLEHTFVPPIEQRPAVQDITDCVIPGVQGSIPIRIYTPIGEGPYPVLLFFHGGGFAVSSIETHDVLCRYLAIESGTKIISVGYRLAPEHPFPAAPEDCYAATKWASDNIEMLQGDALRLYVAGDSAGGTLATVVCLMAKDRETPFIAKQVLLYPVIDYHTTEKTSNYPSYEENATGFGLSNKKMSHFWNFYLKDTTEALHPYACPIRASDLSQLPPALVVTIEKDVLRDEGEAYAKALQEAGVPTRLKRVQGTIHGFMRTFPEQIDSLEVRKHVVRFLQE